MSGPTQSQYEDSIPDGTDFDIEMEEREAQFNAEQFGKPFNYAEIQFDHVKDGSEFYRLQVRSNDRDAHTRWMNISPEQFAAIRELLAKGENS